MVDVIASGSCGNAVLYFGCILIDCAVPYKTLAPYKDKIKLVLLTHTHGDHLNLQTLKALQQAHPTLRIGACPWMAPHLDGFLGVDIYKVGHWYSYGKYKVSPVALYHDVDNCGYRLHMEDVKAFHATDTAHLQGIEAPAYDFYCIEHNYFEHLVEEALRNKKDSSLFLHATRSVNTHLSFEQAALFIEKNKKDSSQTIRLHQSKTFGGGREL